MKRGNAQDTALSLVVVGVLGGLWWLATQQGWVSRVFLPAPSTAAEALADGLRSGPLAGFALSTLGRMVLGWLLASLLGVLLGAAVGSSATARAWLAPSLELLRPLPASALIPIAVAVFGLSPGMVLTVVALGAMWPVLLATIHGVSAVHPRLGEVSQALQLGRLSFLWKIALPHALPDILAGMRLALTVALIVSVVGEMVASQSGLGQAILLAARSYQSGELFAGVILLGLIGLASNALLATVERRLLRWQTR